MKLFNTIVVFDVFTVAESEEEANAAALAMVRVQEEPLDPTEQTAIETRNGRDLERAKKAAEMRPLVGADVSDDDFEKLKGKTTREIHAMIYTKTEPSK